MDETSVAVDPFYSVAPDAADTRVGGEVVVVVLVGLLGTAEHDGSHHLVWWLSERAGGVDFGFWGI